MATPPSFVGMYDFKETLGKGNFSVVKVAEHVLSKQRVAVKIIDKLKLDGNAVQHLHHEVRVMKMLRHPHVVRLYQVVDTHSRLYLILELGEGGDLYDFIHKQGPEPRPVPEPEAALFFRQIVDAVAFCHKHHVAHRDLKPENVVFCYTPSGRRIVKVTDFGLSNNFKPGQMMKTSVGSLTYSSPEVLLQDPYDGPAADVWSLGVILYKLVTAELPFYEHNESVTLTKIMDVSYEVPEGVSPACKHVLSLMLVRKPSERAPLDKILEQPWLNSEEIDAFMTAAATEASMAGNFEDMDAVRARLSIEDHEHILKTMEMAEIDREEVKASLDTDAYDYVTSTYFLLAAQQIQSQESTRRTTADPGTLESKLRSTDWQPGSTKSLGRRRLSHSGVSESASPSLSEAAAFPSDAMRGRASRRPPAFQFQQKTARVVPSGRHTGCFRKKPPGPTLQVNTAQANHQHTLTENLQAMSLSPRFNNQDQHPFKIPSPQVSPSALRRTISAGKPAAEAHANGDELANGDSDDDVFLRAKPVYAGPASSDKRMSLPSGPAKAIVIPDPLIKSMPPRARSSESMASTPEQSIA